MALDKYLNLDEAPDYYDLNNDSSNGDVSEPAFMMQRPADNGNYNGDTSTALESVPKSDAAMKMNDVAEIRKRYIQDNDLEEEDSLFYEWTVNDYPNLENRIFSPTFQFSGYEWRILIFPHGCQQKDSISLFLECMGPIGYVCPEGQEPLYKHTTVDFVLLLGSLEDSRVFEAKYAHHRYTPKQTDWGFLRFFPVRRLTQPFQDYAIPIMNSSGSFKTAVLVRKIKDASGVLWHDFEEYDSKAETGYIGLKNQGATCYMNSLLQSLYVTAPFRQAVFQIPTENEEPKDSIAYALQRIFYNLQRSSTAIGTNELTASFGWEAMDSFMQHDVQEFNRVLQDSLEKKMKGTKAENALTNIFVGKMKSYIKCVDVEYESSRVEDFWDIQLNVKGMKNLQESFRNYIQVETLDGENKYKAENHGLQVARKGVIFLEFPPVLHLQLKRFEYDIDRGTMIKINDRFEFPLSIDLDEFVDPSIERKDSNEYELVGVLVHNGNLHGGHYYALLKPEVDGQWLKFDDDRVTKATMKEVLDENFGSDMNIGDRPLTRQAMIRKFMNAYMLVYVRKSKLKEVLGDYNDEYIPVHLRKRIDEETAKAEQGAKDLFEAHRYFPVKLVTLRHFQEHGSFDYSFTDNSIRSDNETYISIKCEKTETVESFKKRVAEVLKLDEKSIRFWPLITRQNKTIRADHPLIDHDDWAMEKLRDSIAVRPDLLCFWVEEIPTSFPELSSPEQDLKTKSLIFLKYYDWQTETLRGICTLYVNLQDKVSDIFPFICKTMNWPEGTPIKIYEEIRPAMIDEVRSNMSFRNAEVDSGDILTFQQECPEEDAIQLKAKGNIVTAIDYYTSLFNRMNIIFKPHPQYSLSQDYDIDTFELELDANMPYDTVMKMIAEHINIDTDNLRLYSADTTNSVPYSVVKPTPGLTLLNILQPNYSYRQPMNTIFYEILEVGLNQMNQRRCLHFVWLYDGINKEEFLDVWVSRTATYGEAAEALLKRLKRDSLTTLESIDNIRIWQAQSSRAKGICDHSGLISMTPPQMHIFAQEVDLQEPEKLKDPSMYRLAKIFHYFKDPQKAHSTPFFFMIINKEPFSETKLRLQAATGMKESNFSKIQFYAEINDELQTSPLSNDDIVFDILGVEDSIGMNYLEKSTRRGGQYGAIFIK